MSHTLNFTFFLKHLMNSFEPITLIKRVTKFLILFSFHNYKHTTPKKNYKKNNKNETQKNRKPMNY